MSSIDTLTRRVRTDMPETASPHPISALLGTNHQQRVAGAVFVRSANGSIRAENSCYLGKGASHCSLGGHCLCPLSIALGLTYTPTVGAVCDALGIDAVGPEGADARRVIRDFIEATDHGEYEPAQVAALLGAV